MTKIITALSIFLSISVCGQKRENPFLKTHIGVGAGTSQKFFASNLYVQFQHKHFIAELSIINPVTNLTRAKTLYVPKFGYRIGNFTPYANHQGGGIQIQINEFMLDGGMCGKHIYASFTVNSNFIKPQKINRDFAVYGLCFISGLAGGTREAMQHHWPQVEQKYPGIDAQFWNPAISWTNKYRSKLSELIPTFSDGYHLLQFLERAPLIFSIAISATEKPNFKKIIIKAIAAYGANRAGHYLTYNVVFK